MDSKTLSSHSLKYTTLDDLMKVPHGIVRTVGIEVENWTRGPLTKPVVCLERGTIRLSPRDVQPSFREAMVATKTVGAACGTFGSVSWYMDPDNNKGTARRIVVTWSNPFNYDFYTNWLAIGITAKGNTVADSKWTKEMYYGQPMKVGLLIFDRKQYHCKCEEIEIEDDEFVVTGMMGTTHDAKIHVVVKENK